MKKIISIFIPLIPILSIYKSPIPKVDFATFILLIVFLFLLIYIKKNHFKLSIKKTPSNILLLYLAYILIGILLCLLTTPLNVSISIILFRIMKLLLYILFILICINNNIFDYNYSFLIFKRIIIASCLMIVIQTILYYFFSKNIYGVYMPLILQGDYQYVAYDMIKLQYLYRPCSFFLEPSSMTSYFSMFLALLLSKRPNKKSVLFAIIISGCMVLTTSGQAYLYGAILWIAYILKIMKKNLTKKTIMSLLISLIILPIILIKLYNTNIVYKSLQRIVDGSLSGGNAISGRTSSINYFINLPLANQLLGVGYGNPIPNIYFSSFTYTLYCTGIIGLIIIICFFVSSIKKYSKKNALIYWLISSLFSTSFIATNICFYLPFITTEDKEIEK